MQHLIKAFDHQPLVFVKDRNYIINSLTDHYPFTSAALLQDTVTELSKLIDFSRVTKLLGEEDRGGFITALLAYEHKLPFGMAKWNPLGLAGEYEIEFRNAYTHGKMYIHGLQKGDRVVLVEDMVDSGGTIVAMVKLLQKMGIELLDIVVVSVKEGFGGLEKIKQETGFDVKYLLKVTAAEKYSKVIEVKGV